MIARTAMPSRPATQAHGPDFSSSSPSPSSRPGRGRRGAARRRDGGRTRARVGVGRIRDRGGRVGSRGRSGDGRRGGGTGDDDRHGLGAVARVGQVALERARHRGGRRIPGSRVERHRLGHDRVELGRDALAERGRAGRRGGQARERDGGGAVAGERPLPGQRLEQDDAQRVDVRGDGRGLAARLLRAEVVDRAHRRAGERQLRLVERARDPEVGDLDPPVAADEDVRRLDVAVDDAADVRGLEGLRRLGRDAGGLARGERPVAAQDRREVLPLDDLHDEIRPGLALAEVEHGHDVRVVEGRGRAGLVAEAGEEVGVLAELRRAGA